MGSARFRSVLASGLLLATACTAPSLPLRPPFDAQGHRGARGLLPENTLPAFRRAIALGVTTLELDTGVTRDGVVVVSHDPAVSPAICRHADGTPIDGDEGPLLRDLTLAELRRYDCGSRNPDPDRFPSPPWEPVPGETIPTLDEVFALVALDPSIRFNVETKLRPGDRETIPADLFVEAVVLVVRDHGLESRVSIQSFDWRALARTRELTPEIATVALVAPDTVEPAWLDGRVPDPGDPLALFREARAFVDAVSPYWKLLLPESGPALPLDALRAEGFPVVPWTVNDPAAMRRLVRMGVDGMISDYPDRLLSVLRDEGVPVR